LANNTKSTIISVRKRDLVDWITLICIFSVGLAGLIFWITDTSKSESQEAANQVKREIVEKVEGIKSVVEMGKSETKQTLNNIDSSMGSIHKRIGDTNKKIDIVKDKVNDLNIKQTAIKVKLDFLNDRIIKVEKKVE
jgi:peptidoglycan hydrolase CwlO-like protein